MTQPLRGLTPADISRMLARGEIHPDAFFELVDGEIAWLLPTTAYHGLVTSAILMALIPFAEQIGATLLPSNTGFTVGRDRQQLRAPSVALIVKERGHIIPRDDWVAAAPDLAVGVLSKGPESDAAQKVSEYFEAGARIVWLANPRARSIAEYVVGREQVITYGPDDEITLDAIAPGFRARVGSFFPTIR